VEYMVLVAMVLACVAAFVAFRTSIGEAAVCQGKRMLSMSSGACGDGAEMVALQQAAARQQTGPTIANSGDVKCDRMGVCTGGNCFEAGTPVLTSDGERPIETVRAGDMVLARDPETGHSQYRRVVATKHATARPVVKLQVRRGDGSTEAIGVTANHPFYVNGRGWVSADLLENGDLLATTSGSAVGGEVQALALGTQTQDVYNFEVEGLHTYFVGHAQLLVHNDCRPPTQDGWNRSWTTSDVKDLLAAHASNDEWAKRHWDPNPGPSISSRNYNPEPDRTRASTALYQAQSNVNYSMAQVLHSPLSDPNAKAAIARSLLSGPTLPPTLLLPTLGFSPRNGGLGGMGGIGGIGGMGGFGGNDPYTQRQNELSRALEASWNSGVVLKSQLLAYAATSGDDKLRKDALKVAPKSPLSPHAVEEAYATRLRNAFESAQSSEEPSVLKDFAKLMAAKQMSRDPKYARMIRESELEQKLQEKQKDPAMIAAMKKLQDDSIAQVRHSPEYAAHLQMVYSEDFMRRLDLEGPQEARKTLETELGKIAAVEPARADHAIAHLAGRQLMADFGRLDPDKQAAALIEAAELHLKHVDPSWAGVIKQAKGAPDVMKRIAAVVKANNDAMAAGRASGMVEALEKIIQNSALTGKERTALAKALGWIEGRERNGGISTLAATAGAVALGMEIYDGKAFASWEKGLSTTGGLFKTAGAAESFAKLGAYAMSKELPKVSAATFAKAGTFSKTVYVFRFAGPVGDAMSAGLDGYSAAKNFQAGKHGEAWCDVGSTVCATASAGAGLYVIWVGSAAAGPGAPVVAFVGTVGYLGFKGVKWIITDSDEVALLKEVGVYSEPSPGTDYTTIDREIYKYRNSCTSDRRNCPGPIGDRARMLLDGDRPFHSLEWEKSFGPKGSKGRLTALSLPKGVATNDEARVILERGTQFYADHGAQPGSCKSCH
jgi:hypothetical protein